MPSLIDVSHTVEHGMLTYKGLPALLICDFLSREESRKRKAPGTEFQSGAGVRNGVAIWNKPTRHA